MEAIADFYFSGSTIIVDGAAIKMLAPWKESYDKARQYIKKQRHQDTTLPTKVHIVKAMVSPVVMYRYESCTTKKAEHQRMDASELWCWR